MAVVHYGDGTLYGDPNAIYGRISGDLAAAQVTAVRETGLQVRVIDSRLNAWESVNDQGDIFSTQFQDNDDPTSPLYWGYRGFSHLVKLSGGTVVRVRVGNPSSGSDRQVYVQEITDPSNAAQWQAWTLLYSGTHFAAVIVPTGASTYDIWHTKSGVGLCKNNALVRATATDGVELGDGIRIEVSRDTSFPRYMYITIPKEHSDGNRVLDLYVTTDANSVQPSPSAHNFEWSRHTVSLIEDPTNADRWLLYRSFQLHNDPRLLENGESVTVVRVIAGDTEELRGHAVYAPRAIRGLASAGGHHILNLGTTFHASDGFLYLFFYEYHSDDNFQAIQNSPFLFWQRSKDGIHWSEPVLTGFNIPNMSGAFESGDYFYICGNGSVIRRPSDSLEYVLDDYVTRLSLSLPRDNQEGGGEALVANPDGINDDIDSLSDSRIVIKPGIKTAEGSYEFAELGDFWLKRPIRNIDGAINRLTLSLGDIWLRLAIQLRDTFNIVGQTTWSDWWPTTATLGLRPNEPFHYFFETGEPTVVDGYKLQVSGGTFLWTGWKGHNALWSFEFTGGSCVFYARYVDEENHLKFSYSGTTLQVYSVIEGVSTLQGSVTVDAGEDQLYIELKWSQVLIQSGATVLGTITLSDPVLSIGYLGWSGPITLTRFDFEEWEPPITSHDLIRTALAMADYHDVIIGGPETLELAVIWGPQTDVPTPAEALRNLLQSGKLDLVWRDGIIQVGQFKDTSPVRSLENEIISSEYTEQATQRLNLVVVDGNEHSWLEADTEDAQQRDRQIVGYFDLPELMTQTEVRQRAQEEIRRSAMGNSPGIRIPLQLDLWRMDPIQIKDNTGEQKLVRIEGISVEINQSTTPHQREELDTSLIP